MPSLEDGEPFEGFPQTTAADDYGSVYYEVDAFDYSEMWVPGANRTQLVCRILADDAYRFRTAMVGKSSVEGGLLRRQLPEANPFVEDEDGNSTQWCTRLEQIDQGGENTDGHFADDTNNYWPYTGWIRYRATFEGMPFRMREDADIDALAGSLGSQGEAELDRYIVRGQRSYAREQQIPGGGFFTVDDGTPANRLKLMQTGFKTRTYGDVTYTQVRVPLGHQPTAWRDHRGKINDAIFDEVTGGYLFAAGELLYIGFDDNNRYFDANGDWVCDVVFSFKYCQSGWNLFLDKAGNLVEVSTDGTSSGQKPYTTADLNDLFEVT